MSDKLKALAANTAALPLLELYQTDLPGVGIVLVLTFPHGGELLQYGPGGMITARSIVQPGETFVRADNELGRIVLQAVRNQRERKVNFGQRDD